MKLQKTLLLALLASATLGTAVHAAQAQKKIKTDKKAVKTLKSVDGKTFSYAAGVAQSQSLRDYVEQRVGVDSTNFADFIAGMQNAYSKDDIKRMRAIVAGADIATQNDQIIQQFNQVATGKTDTSYVDKERFTQGLAEGMLKKASLKTEEAQQIAQSQIDFHTNTIKQANIAYLEQYAKQKGVKKTKSGLLYKVIEMGKGALPVDSNEVEVHYEGKLIDGTVFDSSYKRNQTTTFGVTQVIKGWTEALKLMPVGSTFELCIPQELAYGERGNQAIPPFSTLIFKVELKGIK